MKAASLFYYYLICINLLAFLLMGQDKHRARHRKWRIPEKTLFLTAILGGSIGSIMGMPCILVAQILLFFFLERGNLL